MIWPTLRISIIALEIHIYIHTYIRFTESWRREIVDCFACSKSKSWVQENTRKGSGKQSILSFSCDLWLFPAMPKQLLKILYFWFSSTHWNLPGILILRNKQKSLRHLIFLKRKIPTVVMVLWHPRSQNFSK